MPTIDNALALAAQGWNVLPLNGKIPRTRHGVKDATTDPNTITQWWAAGARHNIGAQVPGHLVVLDLDPRNDGTLTALELVNGGTLPDTLTTYSGRGDGGQHLYFQHPGGSLSARRLPAGIDVKTSTGYCVVPPSVHPDTGRPYVWGNLAAPARLPERLRELLRSPAPKPAPQLPAANSRDRLAIRARHLAEHVAAAAEGQRNGRLFWAACQALRDGHPRETFEMLTVAAQHAGLSHDEAVETINSAHRTEKGGTA